MLKKSKNIRIINDLRSIVGPSQLLAIMPMLKKDGEEISIPKKGLAYSYALSLALVASSVLCCTSVLFESSSYKIMQNNKGNTEEINQTIETLFCIVSYTTIVISSVSNGGKHCRTLNDIAKIDEFLEVAGFTGAYKCPLLSALLGAVSIGLLTVAFFYIHFLSAIHWSKQCILLGSYAMQMLLASIFAIYLRVILKNITNRIAFVNRKLEEFTDTHAKENWHQLSNLIEILCQLRYITENINSVTGVALLFYMGYAFYTVTNQSYLAFSALTTHSDDYKQQINAMGLSVAWVIAEVTTMTVICSSCDDLSSEANTTSQILARVYGKNKEYQNIIDKFLTKSIKQEVQFTAYGFFVIDNSTLFKIFSAVTTYLVILIQFKQLEDSKNDDGA